MIPCVNLQRKSNYKKSVSFGTGCTSYNSDFYKRKVLTYTTMFRDDLNWKKLADSIAKEDNPQKIYCYACSDGSEPYSIALSLIARLGFEKAKKYFPIVARDIDSNLVKRANNGLIVLEKDDFKRMSDNNVNPKDFFDYRYYVPYQKGMFKVSDKLRECVDFKVGDIFKDTESMNCDNATILFRNVWMYIPPEKQDMLVKKFNKVFKDTTSFVAGALDFSSSVKEISKKYGINVYS